MVLNSSLLFSARLEVRWSWRLWSVVLALPRGEEGGEEERERLTSGVFRGSWRCSLSLSPLWERGGGGGTEVYTMVGSIVVVVFR